MEWVTTTQILDGLKGSGNAEAWNTFTDHFYPIILAFAKKTGLSSSDAEDVAQETLMTFLKLYRDDKYQREKGHLSHWVYGVTRNVIKSYLRKRPKERLILESRTQTCFWANLPDENTLLKTWQTEWQRTILSRCLERIRREFDEKSYLAFERYALQQHPIEDVCRELKISRNAVYIAKSRILTKIREFKECYEE